MNINKSEIGLCKRMVEVYEKYLQENQSKHKFLNDDENEEIQNFKKKINDDIENRRGKKGL
jgi:hypothetical protein